MSSTINHTDSTSGKTTTLKVGDYVGFKYDVEQGGRIEAISGKTITVTATEGGYVHHDCDEDCGACSEEIDLNVNDIWLD